MRKGVEVKVGVGFEEGADDAEGLGGGQGADRVDQGAAGSDAGGGGVEDFRLELGEAGDGLAVGGPARVGVAPPGAEGGAGGVDQDAVEALRLAGDVVAVPGLGRQVAEGAPPGAAGGFLELAAR